jgi:hypothetical protein
MPTEKPFMTLETFAADGRPLTDRQGRAPEIDKPDFVAFPVSICARRGPYRLCYSLEGGRWEGFVSMDPQTSASSDNFPWDPPQLPVN